MTGWINSIDTIVLGIRILVQTFRIGTVALVRILGNESPRPDVQTSGAVLVQAEVELLAGVEVVVVRRAGAFDHRAESVVSVGVRLRFRLHWSTA